MYCIFRAVRCAVIGGVAAIGLSSSSDAAPVLRATKADPATPIVWIKQLEDRVRPLVNDRGSCWPMISWEPSPDAAPTPELYQILLARGLTQHIPLDEKFIPAAQAIQAAGSPVIVMEGQGGNYPSAMAGDSKLWAHQFDAGFVPHEQTHACPAIITGWAINADRIRDTSRKFKNAGVTINAVWMDWEVEPALGDERYEQAIHCGRCRATLPPQVLASKDAFEAYCARKYSELAATYLAAPVAEIFPGCSTTNWGVVVALPQHQLLGWDNKPFVSRVPSMFSATNPVAYGMTLFFDQWKKSFPLDREHVDQMYTHLLLREVSNDAANRKIFAPQLDAVPWVARWCAAYVSHHSSRPIMSRERYREVLRHLWLRGISDMQIFNSVEGGYEDMAVNEVEDAVSVYDEMLAWHDLLNGEPLNLAVPRIQDDGVLWSGLRRQGQAVIRTFKQGTGSEETTIEPWPGKRIRLRATPRGETWLLHLNNDKVEVHRQ